MLSFPPRPPRPHAALAEILEAIVTGIVELIAALIPRRVKDSRWFLPIVIGVPVAIVLALLVYAWVAGGL